MRRTFLDGRSNSVFVDRNKKIGDVGETGGLLESLCSSRWQGTSVEVVGCLSQEHSSLPADSWKEGSECWEVGGIVVTAYSWLQFPQ